MSAARDVKKSILYGFETTLWPMRESYCSEDVKKKSSKTSGSNNNKNSR